MINQRVAARRNSAEAIKNDKGKGMFGFKKSSNNT